MNFSITVHVNVRNSQMRIVNSMILSTNISTEVQYQCFLSMGKLISKV